jgi:hypothetical protein
VWTAGTPGSGAFIRFHITVLARYDEWPDFRPLLQGLIVPYHLLSDISHWRQRAAEFRLLATTIQGADAQNTMLRIAQHYDQLAKSAVDRLQTQAQAIKPVVEAPAIGKLIPT